MNLFFFFLQDDGVENIDEDNHLSAEENRTKDPNVINQVRRWDQRPVLEHHKKGGRVVRVGSSRVVTSE